MNARRFHTANVMPAGEGLTIEEKFADALLRFENFERYVAQSAATGCNDPAPLPPRPRIHTFTRQEEHA